MINLKVRVGEYCCLIEDGEIGFLPWGIRDCPSEDIDFHVSCKHQDRNYIAVKCKYQGNGGLCDYAREVTERDLNKYPNLFREEEDDD